MLDGGAGADILNGGEGADTANYSSSSAVVVDLSFGGLGGQAQGDTYIDVENVDGVELAPTRSTATGGPTRRTAGPATTT